MGTAMGERRGDRRSRYRTPGGKAQLALFRPLGFAVSRRRL